MKRTLSMILAILMVVTIFATVGMADGETEPAGEPEAVETAAPAAGEPAPIAEEPADNGIAPVSEPTAIPEASPVMSYVTLDCNGGTFQGYSLFSFDVIDGKLAVGLGWYAPERPGYRFDGWYDNKIGGSKYEDNSPIDTLSVDTLYAHWVRVVVLDAEPGNFNDKLTEQPNDGGVTQNYTRTVELTAEGKLPDTLPEPVYDISKDKSAQTVEFDGWYTGKCTFSEVQSGDHWEVSIVNGGKKVDVNQPLEEGITTLYAGYKLKAEQSAAKVVTYYYDWNGIDEMYGHCLTSSRSYDSAVQGHKLTVEDLLIRYLNWDGENDFVLPKDQKELNEYWEGKKFNGYTFKGWAKSPTAAEPDVEANVTVIKNGESIYAVWEKDGTSNVDFDRTSKDVGSITTIRFPFGVSASQSVHAGNTVNLPLDVAPAKGTGEIVWTLKVYNSTAIADVLLGKYAQFTVSHDGTVTPNGVYKKNEKTDESVTLDSFGITAVPVGHSLNISTNEQLTVVVSAAVEGHPEICTNFDVSISFSHNPGEWKVVQEPTCDKRGRETTECTVCQAVLARDILPLEHIWGYSVTKEATCTESGLEEKVCQRPGCETKYSDFMAGQNLFTTIKPVVIPPTGHTYEVSSSEVVNGVRVYTETCVHEDASMTIMAGDPTGDNMIDTRDSLAAFQYAMGISDDEPALVSMDVNNDGTVDVRDSLEIFQYAMGLNETIG